MSAILRQPNGGTILAGWFTRTSPLFDDTNWTAHNSVVRMNPDGTLDRNWHLDLPCDDTHKIGSIFALASDSSGNIYIGGSFATAGTNGRRNLARFNSKGELDTTWQVDADITVFALSIDEDDNLFVGGFFTKIGGMQRSYLAKIRDGKIVEEWNPEISTPVYALAIADSSIFAGCISVTSSASTALVVKISSAGHGAADSDWKNPEFNIYGGVYALALDHQGYLYAGGNFVVVNDQRRNKIARFSVFNGDLDINWMAGEMDGFPPRMAYPEAPPIVPIRAIAVDSKNNVFVGGSFDRSWYAMQGSAKNALAKIDAQGKFDNTWGTHAYSDISNVKSLLMENDKLYVGGQIYFDAASNRYALVSVLPTDTLNLNQQGLSGSWGRSATPGTRQGFLFNIYPDNIAPGHGTVFAGWYTYDIASGSGGQRWYALQGDVDSSDNSGMVSLGIYTAVDGNLNSGTNPTSSKVGTATLLVSDCSIGTIFYRFDDERTGFIPISRVTQNTNCNTGGIRSNAPANSLLAGTWIVPGATGMGFVIDVSPADRVLLGSWYTYFPADYSAPSPRQQWFVFQDSNFGPTATASNNIDLLQAGGGSFDATVGGGVTTDTVGKVSLNFQSCTAATFTYTIWPNKLNSQSVVETTVKLVRLGPVPAGCQL